MEDLDKTDNSQQTYLSKLAMSAVGYSAGGILLLILQFVARFRVLGLLIGLIVCAFGIYSLLSKDSADRKPGAFITGAGVLTVLSKTSIPFLQIISGTLLSIGAFGLLASGIRNGIRFLFELKKRS